MTSQRKSTSHERPGAAPDQASRAHAASLKPKIGRLAYSPAEAATSLGLSRDTFDRYVLPALRVVRIGARIAVPVKELERYLEREAVRPLDAWLKR